MIAAAALAAGITREGVKEFEVEVTVIHKVWAYDADDAKTLAWSLHGHDTFAVDVRDPLATGKVDA